MAFQLIPQLIFKWTDDNNDPAFGWKVTSYIAGTTTLVDTYSDDTGTVNDNPITLNARGEARIYLSSSVVYKFVITDPIGGNVQTFDNITGIGGINSGGGSPAGAVGDIQLNADGVNFGASGLNWAGGVLTIDNSGNGSFTQDYSDASKVTTTTSFDTGSVVQVVESGSASTTLTGSAGSLALVSDATRQSITMNNVSITSDAQAVFGNGISVGGGLALSNGDIDYTGGVFRFQEGGVTKGFNAVSISYDNTSSGLSATNVQNAIDEVNANSGVAGSNTEIQFNNNGAFGASSSLTFDGSKLLVPQIGSGLYADYTDNIYSKQIRLDNTNTTLNDVLLDVFQNDNTSTREVAMLSANHEGRVLVVAQSDSANVADAVSVTHDGLGNAIYSNAVLGSYSIYAEGGTTASIYAQNGITSDGDVIIDGNIGSPTFTDYTHAIYAKKGRFDSADPSNTPTDYMLYARNNNATSTQDAVSFGTAGLGKVLSVYSSNSANDDYTVNIVQDGLGGALVVDHDNGQSTTTNDHAITVLGRDQANQAVSAVKINGGGDASDFANALWANTTNGRYSIRASGGSIASIYAQNGITLGNNTTGTVDGTLRYTGSDAEVLKGGVWTSLTEVSTPAGSNTEIQFNNNGAFGASSSLTWNGSKLDVGGEISGDSLDIDNDVVVGGSVTAGDGIQVPSGNTSPSAIRRDHPSFAPLTPIQEGAGLILSLRNNTGEVASIKNDGSFETSGEISGDSIKSETFIQDDGFRLNYNSTNDSSDITPFKSGVSLFNSQFKYDHADNKWKFETSIDVTGVISGDGSGLTNLPSTGGFMDYNDTTGSISLSASTWTDVPNNGAGAFSNSSYPPAGVTDLLDTSTGYFDTSELDLGDTVLIRNDYEVNPSANNTLVKLRYSLGTGANVYTLEKIVGRLDSGSGIDYRFSLSPDLIYMGDTNTKDNPIKLQIWVSTPSTLTNAGSVIGVNKR